MFLLCSHTCELDEACDASAKGAVEPTFALRFALAFLFSVSDADRESFDSFWREIRDPKAGFPNDHIGSSTRHAQVRAYLNGIARSVGMPLDVPMISALYRARGLVKDPDPNAPFKYW